MGIPRAAGFFGMGSFVGASFPLGRAAAVIILAMIFLAFKVELMHFRKIPG